MLIGIDYGSVDKNASPDIAAFQRACAAAGSSPGFAIFRGSEGLMPDSTIHRDWRRFEDAGFICGAYLFLRMPTATFTASAEEQVEVFARTVGTLNANNFVPFLDVEHKASSPQLELEVVTRAWETLQSIYGVAPAIYTSARVWREDLNNLPAGEMVDSPLWLAKPWPWKVRSPAVLSGAAFTGSKYDPEVPPPWGAKNWWIHQYQGDAYPVPGFTSTVDLSRFNTMRPGEIGARVAWVRRRLGLAVAGNADATKYDAELEQAVRSFQKAEGLTVDALIGPRTFTRLMWARPQSRCAA